MSHIYICYSRPNKSYADYLADDLQRRGFEVWIDDRTNLDKQHLLKIVKAIQECDAFILIYSAIAEESNLVQRETDFAIKNEKPFFTLMLQGEAEGADSYDVSDGSLPPTGFYDNLKQHTSVKIDPTTTDDLFEEDEDLFGDLDSIEPIVRKDEKLSIDDVDMDALLNDSSPGGKSNKTGNRRRSRVLLGGLGFIILLLLLVVLAVVLSQEDEEPKVAQHTEVPTATETDVPTATSEPSETPIPTNTLRPSDTPTPTSTNTPAPSLTPLPFWLQPVLANEDWEPVVQEFDGVSMVLVPPGCFTMGSTQAEVDLAVEVCDGCEVAPGLGDGPFEDELPAHEICFTESFWIDQYEITNGQRGTSGFITKREEQPFDAFTAIGAMDYCESREARLPTEAEWEFAAKGPSNWIYPWGMEFDRLFTVSREGHPPIEDVGSTGSTSWVGAYDMSGNVWEWTSSIYLPYPYEKNTHEDPEDLEATRVLRGGNLLTYQYEQRTARRYAQSSTIRRTAYGARCVRDFDESDLED